MTPNEKLDHTPLTKGKYKGKTPNAVADIDPAYVVWMYDNWNPKPCSKLLRDACDADDDFDPEEDERLRDVMGYPDDIGDRD